MDAVVDGRTGVPRRLRRSRHLARCPCLPILRRRSSRAARSWHSVASRRSNVAHTLFSVSVKPKEDGLAGAVTGLADGPGIDDDGIPPAGFERFVERDSSERAHTVEEARPMGVTEDADASDRWARATPASRCSFNEFKRRQSLLP